MVSIIEGQREDLKHREQAQAQAAKIAKRFATAVLAFEERLVQGNNVTDDGTFHHISLRS